MKHNGLVIDEKQIATGLYDIICQQGEEAIVAFGMIPKWIVDMLEVQLRRKIIEIKAVQCNSTPDEVSPFVSEELMQDTMRPIVHAVTVQIYGVASERGMMRV